MSLLDIVGGLIGGGGQGGGGQADLLKVVVGMLGNNESPMGGLGGLVGQLQKSGLGDVVGLERLGRARRRHVAQVEACRHDGELAAVRVVDDVRGGRGGGDGQFGNRRSFRLGCEGRQAHGRVQIDGW